MSTVQQGLAINELVLVAASETDLLSTDSTGRILDKQWTGDNWVYLVRLFEGKSRWFNAEAVRLNVIYGQ